MNVLLKESEITGYLEKLDKEERERCYLSDHFVFYYYGNDEDIIAIIKEYCEQKPDALPVDTENGRSEGNLPFGHGKGDIYGYDEFGMDLYVAESRVEIDSLYSRQRGKQI